MATVIDELRREIHKRGFDTSKGKDGHFRVLHPSGEQVRESNGRPVRFAATPARGKGGGARSLENTVAQLRKVGVLPRPAERGGNTNGDRPKRQELIRRSDVLRPQVQELIQRLGLRQSDVSHFADRRAAALLLPVPSHGQGVLSKFLQGRFLTEANLAWLGGAVDEIREAGGIPEVPAPAATTTEPEPEPVEDPDETDTETEEAEPEGEPESEPTERERLIPTLAFDVMQALYSESIDDERIRELVERVAVMEVKCRG